MITGSGTGLTYNPAGLYKGIDTFKYTVSDGHGGSDQATVVVTVAEDVIDPVATAPSQTFFYQTVGRSTARIRLAWSCHGHRRDRRGEPQAPGERQRWLIRHHHLEHDEDDVDANADHG